jgi:LPXTG-motif cell wall-anchored protein
MSISRRAVTARSLGVTAAAAAIALGAAGTAFACNAADFTPVVSCNQATGQAQITVTESATYGATVSVFTDAAEQNQVGTTQQIAPVDEGTPKPAVVDVPWQTTGPWTIKVVATDNNTPHTFKLSLAAPSGDCAAPAPSKSATPPASPSPSASVSATATSKAPAPSASASASPSKSATTAASPSASASTGAALAETGGGSDSGMLLGIAAGLVVLGGGAVFVVRRRAAAGRH